MSNYILYRTVAYTIQPASYTDATTKKTVTPSPIAVSPVGQVILTQQISDPSAVVVPSGFALAEDADGKYPIGSIYTPPT